MRMKFSVHTEADMNVTTLHPATVTPSEDGLLANAYSDLEPEVTDLSRMARLAEIQMNKAVGQLSCKDRNYIEVPDYEDTDLAIFAVSQMQSQDSQGARPHDSTHPACHSRRGDRIIR